MKKIILSLGIVGVLCLHFMGCVIDTTCLAERDCPCELECSEGHECKLHRILLENEVRIDRVCVMKNNMTCQTSEDCLVEATCINGLCEEKECELCEGNKCYILCKTDQICTVYPDNEEVTCTAR